MLVVVVVVDTVVSSSTIRDFHQNSFWQHHCDGIRKLYTQLWSPYSSISKIPHSPNPNEQYTPGAPSKALLQAQGRGTEEASTHTGR